jgi:predicted Zn-dependent protease
MMFTGGITTFDQLAKEHPQVTSFRSDLAGLRRTSAILFSNIAYATSQASFRRQSLTAWLQARDVLETLVRDQPANVDFKSRLVEALLAAAKMQKADGARDEAIANYTRAVELRQQLAAAAPENETFQKDLAIVQRDLEKLKAAPVAAKSSPAVAPAAKAEDAPAAAAPAAEK